VTVLKLVLGKQLMQNWTELALVKAQSQIYYPGNKDFDSVKMEFLDLLSKP
jgi:hypothetical protein